MGEKKWTPEPWEQGEIDRNEQPQTVAPDGSLIAVWAHECISSRVDQAIENEKRGRECVNALSGRDPSKLEALVEAAKQLDGIRRNPATQEHIEILLSRISDALAAFLGEPEDES